MSFEEYFLSMTDKAERDWSGNARPSNYSENDAHYAAVQTQIDTKVNLSVNAYNAKTLHAINNAVRLLVLISTVHLGYIIFT